MRSEAQLSVKRSAVRLKSLISSGSMCKSLTLLVLLVKRTQPLKFRSSLVHKLVGSDDVQSEL